jgi:hypothetical protein
VAIPSGRKVHSQNYRNLFYFCERRAPRFLRLSSPALPHSFGRFTALRGISLSLYLGYEKIYLIGFDNTHFLNFKVNSKNEVIWRSGDHFYETEQSFKEDHSTKFVDLPETLFSHGIRSIFEAIAILLDDFYMLVDDSIINLDQASWTDCFTKIELEKKESK